MIADLERDEYENICFIKKLLTDEFQDFNSEKLLNMLGIVDDFCCLYVAQDFRDVQILTSILRGGIILLVKEEMKGE